MTPLVFLHGFLGSPDDFDDVIANGLSHLPCICIELPGHGKTPFKTNFLEEMTSLPKMHLIGYSMGGRLAMQYAQMFPDKVTSLTILSAHIGLQTEEEKAKRILLDEQLSQKMVQSFDDFFKQWYDQPLFGGFKPNLAKRKQHNTLELAKTMTHFSLGKQPLLEPKKALFVVGERDRKYRELYPNAEVVLNAAHMVHLENPSQVATLIKQGISR